MTNVLTLNPKLQFLSDDEARDINGGAIGIDDVVIGVTVYVICNTLNEVVKDATGKSIGRNVVDGVKTMIDSFKPTPTTPREGIPNPLLPH